MMVRVVTAGTGTAAQIANTSVAGKTGTAQTKPGFTPHAWFIGFAPADSPKVAIAVVLAGGEPAIGGPGSEISGNQLAAPIAQKVLVELLGQK